MFYNICFQQLGVLDSWFMVFVLKSEFLASISKEERALWYRTTGMHVNESVQEDFVEFIGKPIVRLIR